MTICYRERALLYRDRWGEKCSEVTSPFQTGASLRATNLSDWEGGSLGLSGQSLPLDLQVWIRCNFPFRLNVILLEITEATVNVDVDLPIPGHPVDRPVIAWGCPRCSTMRLLEKARPVRVSKVVFARCWDPWQAVFLHVRCSV